MKRTVGISVLATVVTAGWLFAAGTAAAATPGELNINLTTDCSDLHQQAWQPGPDECVEALQEDLNLMGASVDEDGFFGQETANALTRFQRDFGMNPTGVADATTRHSLQEDVDAKHETGGDNPDAGPDSVCAAGSGVLGKLGEVFDAPCKIILGTGSAY